MNVNIWKKPAGRILKMMAQVDALKMLSRGHAFWVDCSQILETRQSLE
jgi:hypothetical protein